VLESNVRNTSSGEGVIHDKGYFTWARQKKRAKTKPFVTKRERRATNTPEGDRIADPGNCRILWCNCGVTEPLMRPSGEMGANSGERESKPCLEGDRKKSPANAYCKRKKSTLLCEGRRERKKRRPAPGRRGLKSLLAQLLPRWGKDQKRPVGCRKRAYKP